MGFEVIKLPPEKRLSTPLASHTDMLLFRHDNTLITSQAYYEENSDVFESIRKIGNINIVLSATEQKDAYPFDRIFNCLAIGKRLFAKTDGLAPEIITYSNENGFELIPVNQGYPACVALGKDNVAVTADAGMASAFKASLIDTLIISNSEKIKLSPYDYGFIGGACGSLGDKIYFIGNLYAHPDGDKIEKFLKDHGYSCVSLDETSDSLFDMGGILFFEYPEKITAINGSTNKPKNPKTE